MTIKLDGKVVESGLNLLLETGPTTALCMLSPKLLRFVTAPLPDLVLNWEQHYPLESEISHTFIIPAPVAKMLTGGVMADIDTLKLDLHDRNVTMTLQGDYGATELSWQWSPEDLKAPHELEPYLLHPEDTLTVDLNELSDILIQAKARQPEHRSETTIALTPVPATIKLGGHYLGHTQHEEAARFSIKTLLQGIEWVAGDTGDIQISMEDHPARLTASTTRRGWRVQCAIRPDSAKAQPETDSLPTWVPAPVGEAPPSLTDTRPLPPVEAPKRPLEEMRIELLGQSKESDGNGG